MRCINADELLSWFDNHYDDEIVTVGYVSGLIKDSPTIEPERKTGKWEITNLGAVGVFDSCSECKRVVKHKAPFYNFCPHCGAKMEDQEDIPMEYFENGGR